MTDGLPTRSSFQFPLNRPGEEYTKTLRLLSRIVEYRRSVVSHIGLSVPGNMALDSWKTLAYPVLQGIFLNSILAIHPAATAPICVHVPFAPKSLVGVGLTGASAR